MSANETEKGLSWGKWQILHYFKFQLQKKVILPILIHVHINIKFGAKLKLIILGFPFTNCS